MGLLYSHYEANPVTNNSLKINAVSGTLTKTYRESYFINFQKESPMEHFYFREDRPCRIISKRETYGNIKREDEERYNGKFYTLKEVVVLQVMITGEDSYLVEAIDKENYEKMFVDNKGE